MSTIPEGLKILQANYGNEQHVVDVTAAVKTLNINGSVSLTVSPQAFGILDPAPGFADKKLQVNASINGGPPTLFIQDEGKQLVINAPSLKEDDGPKTVNSQLLTVGWYTIVSLIGAYFAYSSYQFGEKGLGSPFLGKMFGIVIVGISLSFAVSDSNHSLYGLPSFIISIAIFQLGLAYCISLLYPDRINFNWTEAVEMAENPTIQ